MPAITFQILKISVRRINIIPIHTFIKTIKFCHSFRNFKVLKKLRSGSTIMNEMDNDKITGKILITPFLKLDVYITESPISNSDKPMDKAIIK